MSWWAQRLDDAVAELIDAGRLSRGRTLARTGAVLSMTVEAGRVRGQVQGSEVRPYTASFLLAPLRDDDASRVLALLRDGPELIGQIVAGQMPEALGDEAHGLFPRFADELDFECTCPDWGWPCKHAAALVQVLVQGIEAQPQTLLELRGVDVAPLLGTVDVDSGPLELGTLTAGALLQHYWEPSEELAAPRVRFRPAIDDLDAELLQAALRSAGGGSEAAADAMAWLREAYRRLE
ncbi:MAG: SWIM zinc finger family protein [Mycobacteriaceae bacterium]